MKKRFWGIVLCLTMVMSLLSATGVSAAYQYQQHPAVTGAENINANNLLSYCEFITPDNKYYRIGRNGDEIDPVVKVEIEDVVSYAVYPTYFTGYTQRNIVTSDGTLYAVTSNDNKKVLATDAKKTYKNHYMTKNGEVKEIESGKVIATDCKDFAESYRPWTIGVIKNDNSFWLGYTYQGDAAAYKEGLSKKLDNAKLVVPDAVVDANNTMYRWKETVEKGGMDPNAWMMGYFTEKNTYTMSLEKMCDNVSRVFPNEFLARIGLTRDEVVHATVTGFAQTKNGDLHGYGFWHHENFGKYGKIEKIFPVRRTNGDGDFVGIKTEGSNVVEAIVCRTCDNDEYTKGSMYDKEEETYPSFVSVTRNGFLASNGKVYSFDKTGTYVKDNRLNAEPNYDKDFGQMHRGTQTFKAFGFGKEETINLLPNVTSWEYDNKSVCLLERSDGSVWMAAFYHSNEKIKEQLGGFENSNAIQVTKPTNKRVPVEYIELSADASQPATTPVTQTATLFGDVKSDAYYAAPVEWAVDKNITTGISDTLFAPDMTCTRAHIITFLWRAVGSPKATGSNPFSDVKASDYFYDAAIWASQKGMVTGNKFEGTTPCTRAATVTYLWQNAGSPSVTKNSSFKDVSSSASYAQAVAWAVNKGITSGMAENEFWPDYTCTRGQIVTFLYRAFK